MLGLDGLHRCPWAASDPLLMGYHDEEWGAPVRGEQPLYERIVLEGFQAGLSWLTVLRKRPAFRSAFAGFDPDEVEAFTDAQVDALMGDPGIIRNRAKIEAARTNARATVALRTDGGLDALLWAHRPERSPAPRVAAEVPTTSAESTALAKVLRGRGFRFVGPTTVHALMEAVGMIDTHLLGCYRRGVAG